MMCWRWRGQTLATKRGGWRRSSRRCRPAVLRWGWNPAAHAVTLPAGARFPGLSPPTRITNSAAAQRMLAGLEVFVSGRCVGATPALVSRTTGGHSSRRTTAGPLEPGGASLSVADPRSRAHTGVVLTLVQSPPPGGAAAPVVSHLLLQVLARASAVAGGGSRAAPFLAPWVTTLASTLRAMEACAPVGGAG